MQPNVGYGPFTLTAVAEDTQYYSVRAKWLSTRSKHLDGIQKLKVQMVRTKETGGSQRVIVIDEAPLYMQFTGDAEKIRDKVNVTFAYYSGGASIGTQQTLPVPMGTTIRFNKQMSH